MDMMRIADSSELADGFFSYPRPERISAIKDVVEDVRARGDEAVVAWTERFDKVRLDDLEVPRAEIEAAYGKVDDDVLSAIREAARRIEGFARAQLAQMQDLSLEASPGVRLGQRVVPIQRVGAYVPGGRYPLPSTALMCVIPAKAAGVKEIVVCSPPGKDGRINPVILVAADIAGADRIFRVGGAQAIAAMAFGTRAVPKVDKIVGPGNKYVAAAKREVYGEVGIDFIAGPSEVLVLADESADPAFIAADLLAQAEHDPDARADVVTTSRSLAVKVQEELARQLATLGTREVAAQSLAKGTIVVARSAQEAIALVNARAPEHLELQVRDPDAYIPALVNYGSLFIGKWTAEVFGDYASGTNHALPTSGAARYTGGLSVREFVKVLTFQELTPEGARSLMEATATLARIEGLEGHGKAAMMRKKE